MTNTLIFLCGVFVGLVAGVMCGYIVATEMRRRVK